MTVPRIIELATRIAAYITRFVCRNVPLYQSEY